MNGNGVPDADSPDDAVYLPGRNPLLLVKAAVWCRLNAIEQLRWPRSSATHSPTQPTNSSPRLNGR